MPNTVYGPFTATTVVNGVTPMNATLGNLMQTQAGIALNGFNGDLIGSGFVLSGITCAKDGSIANQLDVASGRAYALHSDGSVGLIVVASTTFATATINTTYYLDLNPDGTWSWGTSHSGVANYLPICSVTTDASGNIKTVTDARVTTSPLLGSGVLAPIVASSSVAASVTPSQAGTPSIGVTFGGAPAVSGDSAARSALFDGSSGYVNAPTTGLPTGSGAFTLECWVKASAFVATYPNLALALGEINTGTGAMGVYIGINSANKLEAAVWGTAPFLATAAAITTGVWHHCVLTFTGGASGTLTFYVDGASVGSGTVTPNVTLGALSIGAGADYGGASTFTGFTHFLNGSIAEAAIYGAALSAARVAAHYTAATAGGYAAAVQSDSPLRYYRLGEPGNATWANSSVPSTLQTVAADGSTNLGRVATLGGQATTGPLGAPAIIAQRLDRSITSTGSLAFLAITAPVTGLYRISGLLRYGQSTANNVTFNVSYTDPHTGATQTFNFVTSENPPRSVASLSLSSPVTLACLPIVVWAQGGQSIQVFYNDASGTPADYVTAMIERLS